MMSIKRSLAVLILLVTSFLLAHCGGKLVPPADEVTTRMNAKDEKALSNANAPAGPTSQASKRPPKRPAVTR